MNRKDFLNIGFIGLLALLFGVSFEKKGIRQIGFHKRFKVYHDPASFRGPLVGYTGQRFFEAGMLYAPYVPLDLS